MRTGYPHLINAVETLSFLLSFPFAFQTRARFVWIQNSFVICCKSRTHHLLGALELKLNGLSKSIEVIYKLHKMSIDAYNLAVDRKIYFHSQNKKILLL